MFDYLKFFFFILIILKSCMFFMLQNVFKVKNFWNSGMNVELVYNLHLFGYLLPSAWYFIC